MENQQEMSAAELAARKEEMKTFFTEALPYLEVQHQYEKLLAEISEFKFKRLQYDHQYAVALFNINNPGDLDEDDQKDLSMEGRINSETPIKKLKKQ